MGTRNLNKATGDLDMTFKSFIEHYTEDVKPRLKENMWQMKDNLIQAKFLPYFDKLKMRAHNIWIEIAYYHRLRFYLWCRKSELF